MQEHKIKNFDELATSGLRKSALVIAEEGLRAIDTRMNVKQLVVLENGVLQIANNNFKLSEIGKIVFVGIGKCSFDAAAAIEDILGDRIDHGVALDVRSPISLKRITAIQGTHPFPSEINIEGAKTIIEALKHLEEKDLVIFVISGGGSTLLCYPQNEASEEESEILKALMKAGADIREVNIVRKHLSLARGGYLAQYSYPAQAVSLIFSDVPGNDVQFVASGPTVRDETTIEDAANVLEKYNVLQICKIDKCGLIETPKEDRFFSQITNVLAVSNEKALKAMEQKARALGFDAEVCVHCLSGEAREAGAIILEELRESRKTLSLHGGETTVSIKGSGRGGRNLELILSLLDKIEEGELVMTIATDGHDNGNFAGAICDTITKEKAGELGLDIGRYLSENDSYPFFEKAGNYLDTGDTGSNVSDIVIAIKK